MNPDYQLVRVHFLYMIKKTFASGYKTNYICSILKQKDVKTTTKELATNLKLTAQVNCIEAMIKKTAESFKAEEAKEKQAGSIAIQQAMKFVFNLSDTKIAELIGTNRRAVYAHVHATQRGNVKPWEDRDKEERLDAIVRAISLAYNKGYILDVNTKK